MIIFHAIYCCVYEILPSSYLDFYGIHFYEAEDKTNPVP
jgi:hypothetical protein